MISVICVYNNKEKLEKCLLDSLKKQDAKYELILLDNTRGEFKSAAQALNYGDSKAKGEYLMFVHQDVDLLSKDWLEKCEKLLSSIPNLGIAGVAGMSEHGKTNKERGRNVILHEIPPFPWEWGNPIKRLEEVQTLDELLIIIPKKIFSNLKFDEKTCNDWHLYGVDYCLVCKEKGFKVIVLPLEVYHASDGNYPRTKIQILLSSDPYSKTLSKVLKKHKKKIKIIYTSYGHWNTCWPLFLQKIFKKLKKIGSYF